MAAKKKAQKPSVSKKSARKRAGGGSKTAFVLSLPAETSAKDVVAKAKEKGINISEAHVYTIRSTAKRGPGKPKAARAKKAPRAKAARSHGASSNKAAFVRSLPPGTSYAEAAEKAKAAGIQLSKAYYYVLKSEQKKAGGADATKPRTAGRRGGGQKAMRSTLAGGLILTSRDPHEKAVLEAVEALGAEHVRNVISTAERLQNA